MRTLKREYGLDAHEAAMCEAAILRLAQQGITARDCSFTEVIMRVSEARLGLLLKVRR